jgi:hypothetical protein
MMDGFEDDTVASSDDAEPTEAEVEAAEQKRILSEIFRCEGAVSGVAWW